MADKDFKVKNGLSVANNVGIGVDNSQYAIDASVKTDGIALPSGTTGQRPGTPVDGVIRYNETLGNVEFYANNLGGWTQFSVFGANTDAAFLNSQPGSYYTDLTNATGTLAGARFDDTSHGTRAGGTLHATANSTVNGFMVAADKAKLDAMPVGSLTYQYRGEIGNAINLNTLTTAGWYKQSSNAEAAAGSNYPEAFAGDLYVTSDGTTHTQIYVSINGSQAMWHRRFVSSAWTSWRRVWDNVNLTDASVLSMILNVDGAGSSLDSDLLDGQQGSYYLSLTNATGTLPSARFDDTSHGNRSGGALHATANSTVNGFMVAADKAKLDAITYTAADILGKLVTVDGAASGLDADLLDGQNGAYYQSASNLNAGTLPGARFDDTSHGNRAGGSLHATANSTVNGFMVAADKAKLDAITYTAADILAKLITVDGAASGLDAGLVRGTTPGTTGLSVLAGANTSAIQSTLALVPGTNVQAYDAALASISGLTTAANQTIYTTALNTYTTTGLSVFGRTLIDDADAATARTTLGLGTMATAATTSYAALSGAAFSGAISATAGTFSTYVMTNQNFLSSTNTVVIGPVATGAGYIYSRPNGYLSNVNELVHTPTTFTLNGKQVSTESYVVSGDLAITTGSVSFTHGLDAQPKKFGGFLRCIVANNGYSVGDLISFSSHHAPGYAVPTVAANATTIFVGWVPEFRIATAAGTGQFAINAGNANWRVRLWGEL